MKRSLQFAFFCLAASSLISLAAVAQSVPAGAGSTPGIGFQLPNLGGSLSYALNASELISTGFYNSGVDYTTNFSGDLAYFTSSASHPFSAIYTGGVLLANSGQPTTTYQSLSLSQAYRTKNWNFLVQDAASYLPESPVTGLSGIPGVGDVGVNPVPVGPQSGIGILTDYGPRVSNTVMGSVSRIIAPHVSGQVSGFYSTQYFIGDNAYEGINNHTEGGSAGVSYHINALSALTANYNYTTFSYPGSAYSYSAQGATLDYSRQWTRRIATDVYVGPQYLSSTGPVNLPSSTQITAGVSVGYSSRTTFYSVTYSRGANNGSGVVPGSFSDSVTAAAHRQVGRAWNLSADAAYSRNTSLPVFETYTFDSDAVSASGQVTRGFGRWFSGFASYTVERQSISGNAAALNAFSGVYQVVGIGISYSPGTIPLRK